MAVGAAELNALATELYLPRLVMAFGSENLALKTILAKGPKLDGGTSIVKTSVYQYNKGGSYTSGAVFNISGEQNAKAQELPWAFYNFPMTVFGPDLERIDGASKVHDLMDMKFQAASLGATEMIAAHFLRGGLPTLATDIESLSHALDNAAGTLTTSAVYAGINKAVDTWYAGKIKSLGGNVQVTFAKMQSAWTLVHDGGIHPDLIVSHATVWDDFLASQQPQQQYLKQSEMDSGFRTMSFNGVPWVADNHVPIDTTESAGGYLANRIYLLNTKYIEFFVKKSRNFKFVPWKDPVDQDASVAHLRFAGNLLVTDPRRSCVVYDFDPDALQVA